MERAEAVTVLTEILACELAPSISYPRGSMAGFVILRNCNCPEPPVKSQMDALPLLRTIWSNLELKYILRVPSLTTALRRAGLEQGMINVFINHRFSC